MLYDDSAVLQRYDVHDGLRLLLHDDDERLADVLQLLIVSFYGLRNAQVENFTCAFFTSMYIIKSTYATRQNR